MTTKKVAIKVSEYQESLERVSRNERVKVSGKRYTPNHVSAQINGQRCYEILYNRAGINSSKHGNHKKKDCFNLTRTRQRSIPGEIDKCGKYNKVTNCTHRTKNNLQKDLKYLNNHNKILRRIVNNTGTEKDFLRITKSLR